MKMSNFFIQLAIFFFMTITICNAQTCKPSGSLKGRNIPRSECDPKTADCCQANKSYDTYTCSPPVVKGGRTKAVLTQNSFEEGGDGGGPSECDNQFHSDSTRVVALSTGWFQHKSRCGKMITIYGNGRTTTAKVVDECDSTRGCDDEHGYQAPCHYNIVDASDAVWKALGVSEDDPQYGQMDITWSEN